TAAPARPAGRPRGRPPAPADDPPRAPPDDPRSPRRRKSGAMPALALLPPPAPPPPIRPARVVPPPIRPARVAPPPIPLRHGATGCFTGRMQAFRRIMLRGALLRVATLGIYRFWLTTESRRFLWANTAIGRHTP